MLDLRQRASVWIATSFHQRPRVQKHANAWSTHFLPGLMSPARAQTMTSGELRLTGWNPHTAELLRRAHHCRVRHRTITTLRGRRRGAAESGTRKCPWRAEAWRPGGGPTPPMGEAMACTAPHTRPRVGATTRPRSTTVSRVCWTRCQQLACNAKRALHGSKAQRRPRSLFRSRAYETDRSPAIGQRSYAQPIVPAAPAPSAPSCSSSVHS